MRAAVAMLVGLWAVAGPVLGADIAASPPGDVSVTVYRSPFRRAGGFDLDSLGGFALISETRTVTIPVGESRIRFEGVADGIDPASAIVTGLPSGVIEKNRDAHLLSPSALVTLTIGRDVELVRRLPKRGGEVRVRGRILSGADGGVLFQTADGVEALRCSGLSETFDFDADTPGLSARPTLSVLTRSDRPRSATVTLSYLTGGFDWAADYVATLSPDGRSVDLGAWLTLANGNGAQFGNARTQVVAGRLNHNTGDVEPIDRGEPILATCWPRGSTSDTPQDAAILEARPIGSVPPPPPPAPMAAPAMQVVVTGSRAELEQLGDLKLYHVPDRTTVASRQAKQVRLLDRQGTPVERIYGADPYSGADQSAQAASVLLRTRNDAAHHLGLPLPSGRMAVFQARDGDPLLVGQTAVRDLAENETVEWRLGSAPDIQVAQTHEQRTIDRQGQAPIPVIPGCCRRSRPSSTTLTGSRSATPRPKRGRSSCACTFRPARPWCGPTIPSARRTADRSFGWSFPPPPPPSSATRPANRPWVDTVADTGQTRPTTVFSEAPGRRHSAPQALSGMRGRDGGKVRDRQLGASSSHAAVPRRRKHGASTVLVQAAGSPAEDLSAAALSRIAVADSCTSSEIIECPTPALARPCLHPSRRRKLVAVAASSVTPKYGPWGVDYASMDRSVKPGDDFFGYAEGTWLKTAPIAPDKTGAGYNYDLPDQAELDVRAIAEDAERHRDTASARQIADFYAAWMNEKEVEARGLAPLRPYLARIHAVATRDQLVDLMVEPGYASPVDIDLEPDEKDPTRYTVGAGQARLGLPTRDYYLLAGAKYDAIRAAYRAYIVRIFDLANIPDSAAKADRILALETQLSTDQWTPERRRDPVATYNPMDRAQLSALAPPFDWTPTLAHIDLAAMPTVVVSEPSAVAAAGRRLDDIPLSTWKDYLTFRFISDHSQFLPAAFDQAHFDFYSHTLRDVQTQSARWKRGVRLLDADLGESVGRIYVERRWSADTERQTAELIADLHAAYAEKIEHAAWMDDATRKAALAKLATFEPRVGHPIKYIDYSSLQVSRTDPLANAMASSAFEWRLKLSRLGGPVDRTLWDMTPQTVNAYYDPTMNQVTFPAAQLQPPFFDPAADPAVNYGETGATIGHEMGHGFDDEGRQFDAQGRLRDWWTPGSAERYTAHAQNLVKQFDAYEPIPGVHIKGQLTLGENLGDLGGLEAAYAAYRLYVARHGEPPVIDGYTGDQRFFIAYAQSWQGKQREGALRAQLLSNPHSPDAYRVNGIVRNLDPWYAAFHVTPNDALYLPPDQRVHVW